MKLRVLCACLMLAAAAVGLNCAGPRGGKSAPVVDPAPKSAPAPVVAIVFHKMQATTDKAADEIANQKAINEMVAQAIELSGGLKDIVKPGQSVVIKPNLTFHRNGKYQPGETTDVRVASALVDEIKKAADCRITLAEGSGPPAEQMFRICGYDKLAARHNIPLVDYAKDETVDVAIPDFMGDKSYKLPKTYMDADVVIDMPVLKTHGLTGISASLKNYYGLLPNPRAGWHDRADEVLCDVARARKTSLVLVDGIVAMEGPGPMDGYMVQMNIVIAGRDMVAVDAVCAAIMGFDPKGVRHIQYAAQKGVGVADLDKIVIKGTPIEQVRRKFAPPFWELHFSVPRTDANMKRLNALAGGKDPHRGKDGEVVGWSCHFKKGTLVDPAKFPDVVDSGFEAVYNRWQDTIDFRLQYSSVRHQDKAVLVDGLNAWIAKNMETAKPTTRPGPVPQDGADVKKAK